MPTVKVDVWKCGECGHEWLGEEKPKRCARCKSRRWDDERSQTPTGPGLKKMVPDWPEEVVSNGDDESGAKGGIGQDHGETRAADRGGAGDLRAVDKKAGGLHRADSGKSGVRLLR